MQIMPLLLYGLAGLSWLPYLSDLCCGVYDAIKPSSDQWVG